MGGLSGEISTETVIIKGSFFVLNEYQKSTTGAVDIRRMNSLLLEKSEDLVSFYIFRDKKD